MTGYSAWPDRSAATWTRNAYLADSAEGCAAALARLRLILEATGTPVRAVMPLPDRASQVLGIAAAAVLGLPQAGLEPGAAGCLIVAYDLNAADPAVVTALRQRAPGQVLFERATCWASPPRVTADVAGLLARMTVPPWEPHLTRLHDGSIGPGLADDRPAGVVAAEIAATVPRLDEGDGTAPPDSDEDLRRLAAASATPGARAGRRVAGRPARVRPRRRPGAQRQIPVVRGLATDGR